MSERSSAETLIGMLIATVCVILAFALCNVIAVAAVALLITIFG